MKGRFRLKGQDTYFLRCEDQQFFVRRPGWDAIERVDLVYRVHYARASRWSVAVEVASVADAERGG
jgi:hypothetical protein